MEPEGVRWLLETLNDVVICHCRPRDAEIVRDTMLGILFERMQRLRDPAQAYGYLRTTVRGEITKFYRLRTDDRTGIDSTLLDSHPDKRVQDPLATLCSKEEVAALHRHWQALPPIQADCLETYTGTVSVLSVAQKHGIGIQRVYYERKRALATVKRAVASDGLL